MGFLRDVGNAIRRGFTWASKAVSSATAALHGRRGLTTVHPPPG